METTFIYALNDPETGECRYVGKADNPQTRLTVHLSESRKKNHRCANWIKSLTARRLKPVLEILDEVPNVKSVYTLWERAWIKASRKLGMDLINGTDGGDGFESGEKHPRFGKKHSSEACAKMSAALKGKKFSPEHSANMGLARQGEKHPMFGKKHSLETRAKMSIAHLGKKRSLEHSAKISAALVGKKHSSEARAKMSEARSLWHAARRLKN